MNPYLIPGLQLSPAVFRKLIERIPADKLDEPTHPDRFSPREVIAHMADWEPILRDERLKCAIEQPGSSFAAYDEVARAEERNYAATDIEAELRNFEIERAQTVALLRKVEPEAWDNVAHHPERGDLRLSDIANMLVGHDVYHLEQLSAVLP